jgi:hypothetical protein
MNAVNKRRRREMCIASMMLLRLFCRENKIEMRLKMPCTCPVRDKMLVEKAYRADATVPLGTEYGNIHRVPDGMRGLRGHLDSTNIMCLTAHRLSPNLISPSFVFNKTTSVAEKLFYTKTLFFSL